MTAWIFALSALLSAPPAADSSNVRKSPNQSVAVVCPEQLNAGLTQWLNVRRQANWDVQIVKPLVTAEATQAALRELNPHPAYVVLVGDCQLPTIAEIDPTRQTPTFYIETPIAARFGSTENAATDMPYGDLDGDDIPEASVGRLPADNIEALTSLLQRSIAAEANRDFGMWRRQVHLVAGVGNFGFLADAAIEAAASGMIQTLLPGGVQTSVLYASERSPFFPGFDRFRHQATQRYSDGGLAWVYIGHGQVTELDRVPAGSGGLPILSTADLDRLKSPAQAPPLAVMLACYTGAFDARSDCIAERMVLTDGGPIAAIAGTRVTMPYGNASLAAAMMDAWFYDQVPRLGDILALSRRRLLTGDDSRRPKLLDALASTLSPNAEQLGQERREHASLYNLLGDPTFTLRHADPLTLDGPTRGAPGDALEIVVKGMKPGKLTVELCLPLGQVRQKVAQGEASQDAHLLDRCEVVTSEVAEVVKLNIPSGISGECTVRGFCSSQDSCGFGAMLIRVVPRQEPHSAK